MTKWTDESNVGMSLQKSKLILFTIREALYQSLAIALYGSIQSVSTQYKVVDIVLDPKLTFIPYAKYFKDKCLNVVNLLQLLPQTTWNSDRKRFLKLRRSLVGSHLDYSAISYLHAASVALEMFDHVLHLCIRLVTGAFWTSLAQSFMWNEMHGHSIFLGHIPVLRVP